MILINHTLPQQENLAGVYFCFHTWQVPYPHIWHSIPVFNHKFYASGSVFCGDGLNFHKNIKQGVNATLRFVYRPLDNAHTLLHIGTGGLYKCPDKNTETGERSISLKGTGDTYLPVPFVFDSTISHSQCQYQWNIESIFHHLKFFLQGEVMGMIIRRNNSPSYNAYGGYIEGGYFILGNRLGYDRRDALPLCPENKNSLAIFVRVNLQP